MAHYIIRQSKRSTTKKTGSTKPKKRQRSDSIQEHHNREYAKHLREMKQLGIPDTFLFRGRRYKTLEAFRRQDEAIEEAEQWREEEGGYSTVKVFETRIGKVYVHGVARAQRPLRTRTLRRKGLGIPDTFLFRGRRYRARKAFRSEVEAFDAAEHWREENGGYSTVKVFKTFIGKVYVHGVAREQRR